MILFGWNVAESLGDETRLLKFQVLMLVVSCMVCVFSVPQGPHLLNEDHNIMYLIGLLWRLSLIHVTVSEHCVADARIYWLRLFMSLVIEQKQLETNLVVTQLIKLDTNASAVFQCPLLPLKSTHQIYVHGHAK